MPNPLHAKSGGHMVLMVPLIVFMDNISGNISKQWNKHHVVYMSNASMPWEKEFCICFVSSSPHASLLELIRGVKQSIKKATNNGIIAWDCKLHQEVMLILYKLFLAGDNPMQAEECSHGGLKCNYFCQTCKVSGTNAEKKSDEGYCKIFEPGDIWTPSSTLVDIKEQLELAKQSAGTEKVKNAVSKSSPHDAASAAIKDRLLNLGKCKHLRKQEAGMTSIPELEIIDNVVNPLLRMPGVDIHQDMPIKSLHTILLGIIKYYWGQTIYILDKAHLLSTFQTHLESINNEGLKLPMLQANYIVQFRGSLIGKHFKSLTQVMPYLIYDLVPQTVLEGWTVIGELVVFLWHTEIKISKITWYIIAFLLIA
ncbi:hypothetical protein BS17DRAFT_707173 [Gyrodon lividus]|nr:hypothetical protein BS17DRAFT_707173 [Gyrodon lividus]